MRKLILLSLSMLLATSLWAAGEEPSARYGWDSFAKYYERDDLHGDKSITTYEIKYRK